MPEPSDLETLVASHYAGLYQFAFSLARNEAEACDLTQQTFLVWATKGHQLRDVTKVKTWLFTTLYREFLENQRRQTRFPHQQLDETTAHLPEVPSVTDNELDSTAVLEALANLEECFQAPLALYYLEDLSYKEIAETLQLPLGTVKSRISRGISQLHQRLDPHPTGNRAMKGRAP